VQLCKEEVVEEVLEEIDQLHVSLGSGLEKGSVKSLAGWLVTCPGSRLSEAGNDALISLSPNDEP
jgi:hypothetical protein